MLFIIFSILLILPILQGIGSFVQKKIRLWEGISGEISLGMIAISIVLSIVAFFQPINSIIEIIIFAIGIFLFLFQKNYLSLWKFINNNYLLFSTISLIICFLGSFAPFILDHFGYYQPSILWISEIGLTRGISNLDLLLGQMSIWHILQAGFSHFSDPYLKINIILLISYLIYLIEKKSYIHLLFFPILFLFGQSPSPDLPVIVFSLILLNEIIDKNENINGLFTLSIFIFMIKPTAVWVVIFTFLYGIFCFKFTFKWIWVGTFLMGLFIFKNIWLFGYPIFPMNILDLGVSWKPNPELMRDSAEIAISKTYDMQYSYQEIMQFSTYDYIKNWFLLSGIKGKIHTLFILSLLTMLIFSIRANKKIFYLLSFSIIIKSTIVLLFSAQYRFFIEIFFVVFFILLYQKISNKLILSVFFGGTIIVGSILSQPSLIRKHIPSFRLGEFMSGFLPSQLIKPHVYHLNNYETHKIGNLTFHFTRVSDFSFDTPPPSISISFLWLYLKFGIFPQQNTENIRDGIYWRKLTKKEKQQLEDILTYNKKKRLP